MRILLVQPDHRPGPIGFRLAAMSEPLALELLAAMVPGHEVRILDLRVDSDLDGTLADFQPELVAVTALTTEVYAAQEVLARVKQFSPEVLTVVGGHHATLLPHDFQLPYVDAIGLGEGEFVFPQLVEALELGRSLREVPNLVWRGDDGCFVQNQRDVPKLDGDCVPQPRRDLVAQYRSHYFFLFHKPDTFIATGRGCPFRCNFCSVWEFYQGKTRQMSARRVLEELREVKTGHVTFVDDNFLMNARREHEIADRIQAEGIALRYSMECRTDSIVRNPRLIEKWAKIGLEGILLGLEGVSDQLLSSVDKRNSSRVNDEAIRILHANGIVIWGAFMADPHWTADQFKTLLDYVHTQEIPITQFTVLTPLPGTELYRQQRESLLTDDYTCFDTLHAVVPTRLPREEFYQNFASLYRTPNPDAFYNLLRQGRLSIEQIKVGNRIMKPFGRWENYLEGDPVLGNRGRRAPEKSLTALLRPKDRSDCGLRERPCSSFDTSEF